MHIDLRHLSNRHGDPGEWTWDRRPLKKCASVSSRHLGGFDFSWHLPRPLRHNPRWGRHRSYQAHRPQVSLRDQQPNRLAGFRAEVVLPVSTDTCRLLPPRRPTRR
jgi:hypothetical protein